MTDLARTLALLWRKDGDQPAARRGRRPGLTVDAVVDAATALADAEGIDALTMRRLAQQLGVVPMTLYTYAPGKAELFDLMLDKAYLGMERADTTGRPWRERLTAVAAENRALFARHPWALTAPMARPTLGPGQMAKYEHELRAFDDCGLGDVERDEALTFLLGFVHAAARSDAETRAVRSEQSDEQWWGQAAPLLTEIDYSPYPVAVRVGTVAGEALQAAYRPDRAYEFGLARVLDGLGALVER